MRETDLLLDELDSCDCWCGRDPAECEESGGCRWTRELADRERQVRARVAEEIGAVRKPIRGSAMPDFADAAYVHAAMIARGES